MSEWGIVEDIREKAVIKVMGVGGGGGNAVQHMVNSKIEGAEFICLNTDKQALEKMQATTKIVLGKEKTSELKRFFKVNFMIIICTSIFLLYVSVADML